MGHFTTCIISDLIRLKNTEIENGIGMYYVNLQQISKNMTVNFPILYRENSENLFP